MDLERKAECGSGQVALAKYVNVFVVFVFIIVIARIKLIFIMIR